MLMAYAMLRDANMGVLDKLKIVAMAKRLRQIGRSAVSGCGFPRQLLRLRPAIPGIERLTNGPAAELASSTLATAAAKLNQ